MLLSKWYSRGRACVCVCIHLFISCICFCVYECINKPSVWSSVCGGGADDRWAEGRRPVWGRTAWTLTDLWPPTHGLEDRLRPAHTHETGRPEMPPHCRLHRERQSHTFNDDLNRLSLFTGVTRLEVTGERTVETLVWLGYISEQPLEDSSTHQHLYYTV